jgi:hypothetical protein
LALLHVGLPGWQLHHVSGPKSAGLHEGCIVGCLALYASEGAKRKVVHAAFWASLRSTGVFLPWDFTVGQKCFQGCEVGLGFRDMSVQLGH